MSGAFDQREEGFEKRFILGEEMRFKARARRNRALGLWAAEKLGLEGDAAKALAEALVAAQIGSADDEALVARLNDDFARAGIDVSAHRIRRKLDEAAAQALADIQAGR